MKKANTPLYFQIYETLHKGIKSGLYQEGDKLPSERKLCEEYNVSRITVREALDRLEKDHLIKENTVKAHLYLEVNIHNY